MIICILVNVISVKMSFYLLHHLYALSQGQLIWRMNKSLNGRISDMEIKCSTSIRAGNVFLFFSFFSFQLGVHTANPCTAMSVLCEV